MGVSLRPAGPEDAGFLAEMLGEAVAWRPGAPRPTPAEVLRRPGAGHYLTGWPRPSDRGVVAEADGGPVGAAWYRFLPATDPGYGYVADDIGEVTIAVRSGWRGRGVGGRLLVALVARARQEGQPGLSLSVEAGNPARRLYEAAGFSELVVVGGAATMVRRLRP